jgi:hypothetical protein
LPRTPPRKSYSGIIWSSASSLAFFIIRRSVGVAVRALMIETDRFPFSVEQAGEASQTA